jgi:hypothetical protein
LAGGNKEGSVLAGVALPGHIHTIPSCSMQGSVSSVALTCLVDGIFSHLPVFPYSQPITQAMFVCHASEKGSHSNVTLLLLKQAVYIGKLQIVTSAP